MIRRVVLMVLAALLLGTTAAQAHPLGNFTVNHYARAELSGAEIYLRYVADLAEVPTVRERSRVDARGGLGPYAVAAAGELAGDLRVSVDGRRAPLEPVSQVATLHPGAAGLETLRLAAWYRATLPPGLGDGPHRVSVRDETFAGRLGWREVIVRASSGAMVGAGAPTADLSDELRSYPGGLLSNPLNVTEAEFAWTPGQGAGAVGPLTRDPESRPAEAAHESGGFASLVEGDLSAGVIAIALLLALAWGALHALSPGHGKSMVAAYLVGTRGTARHAFLLGAFVTLTHITSVVLFGLAALWLSEFIVPETLFRWLSLAAGLLVVAIGAWVLRGRLRRLLAGRRRTKALGASSAAAPHLPELALAGAHTHPDRHPGHGQHDHGHVHAHHHHEHGHEHGHDRHDHGSGAHGHAPPEDLSVRRLAAAGLTAGLLPCPSAMVLLLGAISLHRTGYGLLLVAVFSLGLAGLLTLIGLLVLYARGFMERLPLGGRLASSIPVASALVIVALGVVLTARAVPGLV